MQSLGTQNVGLEALEQRHQHRRAAADLVGQGRQANGHALLGITLGLPVERLVLAKLLEGRIAWLPTTKTQQDGPHRRETDPRSNSPTRMASRRGRHVPFGRRRWFPGLYSPQPTVAEANKFLS